MALFLIHALDKPGSKDVRMANRPEHLDWAAAHADKIAMAGPMFEDDGETFKGSCFVIEFDTLEEVKAWQAEDPYVKAGLFGQVSITPFRWVIGEGKPAK